MSMKLKKVELVNFASYSRLEFDFDNKGCCLVFGPTGVGKSTLLDAIPWILYGVTAKNGSVDDIRSWNNPESVTKGVLELELKSQLLKITRVRDKPGHHDLYIETDGKPVRGKDIPDTQKIINTMLGIDDNVYMLACYFNEFSLTNNFFMAKAKDRRELFESIANLEMPVKLSERIVNDKKNTNKTLLQIATEFSKETGKLQELRRHRDSIEQHNINFSKNQETTIEELKIKSDKFLDRKTCQITDLQAKAQAFEVDKNSHIKQFSERLEDLELLIKSTDTIVCKECGQTNKKHNEYLKEFEVLCADMGYWKERVNPYLAQIKIVEESINPYPEQIEKEYKKENVFGDTLHSMNERLPALELSTKVLSEKLNELEFRLDKLGVLSDLCKQLKSLLLRNSIKSVERDTNHFLETYFASEFRVTLEPTSSDDLDVSITKDGHAAMFSQLSKGQRGLLKLCFSVAIMNATENKTGIHFHNLFFDEALDGLDANLKVSAYNLFEELALGRESVIVIEHSVELRQLFSETYEVKMEKGESVICT